MKVVKIEINVRRDRNISAVQYVCVCVCGQVDACIYGISLAFFSGHGQLREVFPEAFHGLAMKI